MKRVLFIDDEPREAVILAGRVAPEIEVHWVPSIEAGVWLLDAFPKSRFELVVVDFSGTALYGNFDEAFAKIKHKQVCVTSGAYVSVKYESIFLKKDFLPSLVNKLLSA